MAKKNTPRHNPKGKRPRRFYHYGSGMALPTATHHETGWLKEYRRERSEWAAHCRERMQQQAADDGGCDHDTVLDRYRLVRRTKTEQRKEA